MTRRSVTICNVLGLHARAAAKLVKLAGRFVSVVKLARQDSGREVDGKSILGVLLLAASQGTRLEISARGADQEEAVAAIVEMIENGFGEL